MAKQISNPPHPSEVLREIFPEQLGLSVTETAEALGVRRKTYSAILNEPAGTSPEMASRLAKAFDTSLERGLNQQLQHELWHAQQGAASIKVKRFKAA